MRAHTEMRALDSQLELISWWKSITGRTVAQGFIDSTRAKEYHAGMFVPSMTGDTFAQVESMRLDRSPTYFVSPPMADTIAWASRTWPGQHLQADDLPSEYGFVYLEKPVVVKDVHMRIIVVRAMSWGPAARENDPWHPAGVSVTFYSDISDPRDPESPGLMKMRERGKLPLLSMFHVSKWVWREHPPEIPRTEDQVEAEGGSDVPLSMHDWILAFWTIVQQEIVVMPRAHIPRGLMRRALRIAQAPEFGDVRVVLLRRAHKRGEEHDGEGQERLWSHRWLVRGHWRRLHAGTPEERLTWVMEHVKGPEHLPLILKDNIFSLRR